MLFRSWGATQGVRVAAAAHTHVLSGARPMLAAHKRVGWEKSAARDRGCRAVGTSVAAGTATQLVAAVSVPVAHTTIVVIHTIALLNHTAVTAAVVIVAFTVDIKQRVVGTYSVSTAHQVALNKGTMRIKSPTIVAHTLSRLSVTHTVSTAITRTRFHAALGSFETFKTVTNIKETINVVDATTNHIFSALSRSVVHFTSWTAPVGITVTSRWRRTGSSDTS